MIRVRRNSRLPGVVLSVLVLSSVGLLAPAAAPASPLSQGPASAREATQETVPPGKADKTAGSLTKALEALAAKEPSPNRAMVREAFSAAGFAGDSVEVSLDVTPTGLAVDSIRGAAADQGSCIFGEVREGQVAVSVLPVLDSGFCFVGDQR